MEKLLCLYFFPTFDYVEDTFVRENPNNIWFSAHLIVPLQPKETNKIITTMGISVDSIWSQAQRLSASDRLALSRRLRESVNETEVERRERVASEIDRFFGGWSDDPRTTDEMMEYIRAGRTPNTYPKF